MSNDYGYGQRMPHDWQGEYNTLSFIIRQLLGAISTATLVKVLSCTRAGEVAPVGFVDVQPLVNQIDGLANAVAHAKIYHLPYFRLQGGANAIICDPEKDDIGIAVFADRDITTVKNTKAQANPGSRRRFDMSDGIYVGGVLNKVPDQYLEFITGTGLTIRDKSNNRAIFDTNGIQLRDKNGNSIVMTSAGTTVTDCNGNTIVMNNTGIRLND